MSNKNKILLRYVLFLKNNQKIIYGKLFKNKKENHFNFFVDF